MRSRFRCLFLQYADDVAMWWQIRATDTKVDHLPALCIHLLDLP
jgi:hypothetical protein